MRGIDGFFTEEEGRWYARFARSLTGGTFVEVGSWRGRSTSFVGPVCNARGTRLVCVDHWRGSQDALAARYAAELASEDVGATFLANMRTLGIAVDVIVEDSVVAARRFEPGSVDRVFLDASHDGPSVAADLAAWWERLAPTGRLAGHDYDAKHPDLAAAVDAFAARHRLVVRRGPRSIWWLEPLEAAGSAAEGDPGEFSLYGRPVTGNPERIMADRPAERVRAIPDVDLAFAQETLGYFALAHDDVARMKRVRAILGPRLPEVIESFYGHLARFPGTRALLTTEELVRRLKATQATYLASLGDFDPSDEGSLVRYFEMRLRVGRTHWQVGLAPPLYIGAYAKLGNILMEMLGESGEPDAFPLVLSLQKVLHLDSHLAMAAYEEARRHEALARAEIDAVTGLPSRGRLVEQLGAELARAERFGHPFSVVFVDADRFKEVNDRHGHDAGDAVLRAIADELRASVRPADLLGRYGGDEFVVGLVEADDAEAWRVGLRIQERLAERDVSGVRVTVSVGVASRRDREPLDALIAAADQAMYGAKSGGRNSVRSRA